MPSAGRESPNLHRRVYDGLLLLLPPDRYAKQMADLHRPAIDTRAAHQA